MTRRRKLKSRYGLASFGIGATPDYILMYGHNQRTSGHPYALLEMAIAEARALSKPNSYGGEVFVVERSGAHTREVGVARNGRFIAS